MRQAARRGTASGVAAVEFALIAPFLGVLLLGLIDLGMAYHAEMQLAGALAAAAQYAFVQGQSLSGTALTGPVATFVRAVSPVTLSAVTVTYNGGLSATRCYCVSGATPQYSGPFTCGATCTDGSGSTAGTYVSIAASVTYTPISTLDTVLFPAPLSQSVTVRLQ